MPSGGLYNPYHLSPEPETTIDNMVLVMMLVLTITGKENSPTYNLYNLGFATLRCLGKSDKNNSPPEMVGLDGDFHPMGSQSEKDHPKNKSKYAKSIPFRTEGLISSWYGISSCLYAQVDVENIESPEDTRPVTALFLYHLSIQIVNQVSKGTLVVQSGLPRLLSRVITPVIRVTTPVTHLFLGHLSVL